MGASETMKKVAIVYHVFPHYRRPIMERLLASRKVHFILYGDTRQPKYQPLKLWWPTDEKRFVRTKNRYLSLGYKKLGTMPVAMLFQPKLLALALRRDVSTIIYLADPHSPSHWLSIMLARMAGKRVVYWTHGMLTNEAGIKNMIRKAFWRLAHAFLFYGHRARCFALARGFSSEDAHVVYNSLDFDSDRAACASVSRDDCLSARRTLFANPERPILVCCSRLERHPRLDMLIEAAALLQNDGFPCNVLLIGDGAERAALEELARSRGVSVYFEGACYDARRIALLLRSSDVTVSPGCIGLSAITSMTFGTPVITHDDPSEQGPEWESIVPGQNGMFFRKGDIVDLANVIRKWCGADKSRESVEHWCREVVEKYYNPLRQQEIIERAVLGEAYVADDFLEARAHLFEASNGG